MPPSSPRPWVHRRPFDLVAELHNEKLSDARCTEVIALSVVTPLQVCRTTRCCGVASTVSLNATVGLGTPHSTNCSISRTSETGWHHFIGVRPELRCGQRQMGFLSGLGVSILIGNCLSLKGYPEVWDSDMLLMGQSLIYRT